MKNRLPPLVLLLLALALTPVQAQEDATETPEQKLGKMHPKALPQNPADSFHRRAVDSTEAPWRAVGRVNIDGRAHCTGTLVADRLVLTAAHCLYSLSLKAMVSPGVVHFLAGYAKGEYQGHSSVLTYRTGAGFDGTKGASQENLLHDWAILVLDEPLGATLGHMDLHPALAAGAAAPPPGVPALKTSAVTTAGYPKDRAHILSLEEGCAIQGVGHHGQILLTDCVGIQGDSGGPILQRDGDNWVIVGVQAAATMVGNRRASMGTSALAWRDAIAETLAVTAKAASH